MQHASLSSVPRMLLRVASSINDDAFIPLRVPAPTIAFLHRLGKQCDHSTKPLGRFLLLVPCSQLVNQIIRSMLPGEFQELRAELECLHQAKEDAVAKQEWKQAAVLRDQMDSLKDRLRQMCQDVVIDIQPDHVLGAISNLGFDQTVELAGRECGNVESTVAPNRDPRQNGNA